MKPTISWLQQTISAMESQRDEVPFGISDDHDMALEAFKLALAGMEAEPVAWIVGGIATHDKKWAVRRSEEDNLLMEPLYMHPIITGIDENHYDPELEPGLYVAEIMTKGGAAIINGYYTAPQPLTTSERAELENYRNAQQVVPEPLAGDIDSDDHPLTWSYHNGWNACRAAMLQAGNSPVIPDGCCIMPMKLTAENGAKGALSGEFHVTHHIVCQSCGGEGCEDCNEEGGWDGEILIGWDIIKQIHDAAVKACSLPAAPQQEV